MIKDQIFINNVLYCKNGDTVILEEINIRLRTITVVYKDKHVDRKIESLGKTLFPNYDFNKYNNISIFGLIHNNVELLTEISSAKGDSTLEVYNMTKNDYIKFIHKNVASKYIEKKTLSYKGETDKDKIKYMIAKDMGDYRHDESPAKAIALFKKIEPYFEEDELDGAILTSLVAACCDVDNMEMAEYYLNKLRNCKDYKKYSKYISNLEKRIH